MNKRKACLEQQTHRELGILCGVLTVALVFQCLVPQVKGDYSVHARGSTSNGPAYQADDEGFSSPVPADVEIEASSALAYVRAEAYSNPSTGSIGVYAYAYASSVVGDSESATCYAEAKIRDWVWMTIPAGEYPMGAMAQMTGEIDGTIEQVRGDGGVSWEFELSAMALGAYGSADGGRGLGGGIGDDEIGSFLDTFQVQVQLVQPGTILTEDRVVSLEIAGSLRCSAWSIATRNDREMFWSTEVDYLNTGAITSLILPATSWSSASGLFPSDIVTLAPANLSPVPVPGAVLLGVIGLSHSGWRLRRKRD